MVKEVFKRTYKIEYGFFYPSKIWNTNIQATNRAAALKEFNKDYPQAMPSYISAVHPYTGKLVSRKLLPPPTN